MSDHDYRVAPMSIDQIESYAQHLRSQWGLTNTYKIDVFSLLFLSIPKHLLDLDLKLIPRSSRLMSDKMAYATSKPRRIFYRKELLAQLRLGQARASIIFLHELAHIILHRGIAPKAWMVNGNAQIPYIETERSAEWQATMLALALKAPKRLAEECMSPAELQHCFGLDNDNAEKRFEVLRRQRQRSLPSFSTNPISQQEYTDFCPSCGSRLIISSGCKSSCIRCKIYGDKYQDGDTIGFDF